MKFIFPTAVFLGASLYGYIYGEIPLPGSRSPSSLTQRTLSSLQLAGSAYALSDLLHTKFSSETLDILGSPESIHKYGKTGVFGIPNPINDTFFIPETRILKPPSTPTVIGMSDKDSAIPFEKAIIAFMVLNFGILVKLILYRNEDRASELKIYYAQREYMEWLFYNYSGEVFTGGINLWQLLDQRFRSIESSMEALHGRFEKFDIGVKELEVLTEKDRLDMAMARWIEFHKKLRELSRETSRTFSAILRNLEASFGDSESSDADSGDMDGP